MSGVLIEGETRLSRTGGIGGLRGSDIVLSGPTQRENDLKTETLKEQLHLSEILCNIKDKSALYVKSL